MQAKAVSTLGDPDATLNPDQFRHVWPIARASRCGTPARVAEPAPNPERADTRAC